MTAMRSTKEHKFYAKLRKNRIAKSMKAECIFCDIVPGHQEHISEHKYHRVIKNFLPYSLWDDQNVADHLMLIPSKHTAVLDDKTPDEAVEFVKLISIYEQKGYNIYARATVSKIRSIVHQHTHLIKPRGERKKFLLMIRRPFYLRVSK